eukprot:gnl/TRDRNA2_/TRDRNA2_159521_c0_seq2.p1 gnl/TRDRNA2_/TRDRNA2_159521_c0~~gnl/TRDRNA2_/TRDRNA2_159521_c0_seq2.p1  ORF type:complete len:236 (-),score=39.98 gnl/TRDRNA2_/TRDRNA2_159521_c0_seq2:190-897(-)
MVSCKPDELAGIEWSSACSSRRQGRRARSMPPMKSLHCEVQDLSFKAPLGASSTCEEGTASTAIAPPTIRHGWFCSAIEKSKGATPGEEPSCAVDDLSTCSSDASQQDIPPVQHSDEDDLQQASEAIHTRQSEASTVYASGAPPPLAATTVCVAGPFDGHWELSMQFPGRSVSQWLQTFSIFGDRVVDGEGKLCRLQRMPDGEVKLEGGTLKMWGNVLLRRGKQGISLTFKRRAA